MKLIRMWVRERLWERENWVFDNKQSMLISFKQKRETEHLRLIGHVYDIPESLEPFSKKLWHDNNMTKNSIKIYDFYIVFKCLFQFISSSFFWNLLPQYSQLLVEHWYKSP